MPIQMTRAEYEAKFGSKPVLLPQSEIDSEPVFSSAPTRMTRAEYDAKFGIKEDSIDKDIKSQETFKPLFPARTGEGPISAGLKTAGNIIPSAVNLGRGIVDIALNPIDTVKSIFSITKGAGAKLGREVLEQTPLKDRVGQVEESDSEQAFNQVVSFFKDNYYGTENLQRTTTNDPFGFAIDVLGTIAGGAGAIGKLDKLDSTVSKVSKTVSVPSAEVFQKAKQFVSKTPEQIITKRADEIFNIENSYTKNRNINDISKDAGNASRQRIATTDVLVDSVDENGLVRTRQKGGAVEQYRKQTVDGFEDVVRQNLEREGATVNLNEVRKYLNTVMATSRLEGSDLISALNKVNKEIAGLSMRADEFGNIPLAKLQDAKIATTRNIDYTKKLSANYRKALANGYKTLIEKKSQTNVAEINQQLAKYYEDIERLSNLDGRKVKGGKLGKYFAQITGNVAGAAAGSIAGPLGMVAGTVVGGEVSAALKGKTLSKAFGKELGLQGEKNKILELAKQTGELPKERNLRVPDLKVSASKNIPKTPEITKIESLIADNIKKQKAAIKAKDYTLVSTLKDIYNSLVETLVDTIKEIKNRLTDPNTPNKQGGFVRIGKETPKTDGKEINLVRAGDIKGEGVGKGGLFFSDSKDAIGKLNLDERKVNNFTIKDVPDNQKYIATSQYQAVDDFLPEGRLKEYFKMLSVEGYTPEQFIGDKIGRRKFFDAFDRELSRKGIDTWTHDGKRKLVELIDSKIKQGAEKKGIKLIQYTDPDEVSFFAEAGKRNDYVVLDKSIIKQNSQPTQSLPKSKVNESVSSLNDTTLLKEAKKDTSYRSVHQIDTKNATPVTQIENKTLDSFISEFRNQYGYPALKSKEVNKLKEIINNPEKEVKIYRASPKNELNSGDWVTIDKDYANDIKRQNGGKVYVYTVKAKQLYYPKTIDGFKELPSLNKWGAFQFIES
jgi:hypothetical protein